MTTQPIPVIHVRNASQIPFHGVLRTVVDIPLPGESGRFPGGCWRRGKPVGIEGHVVDVCLSIAADAQDTIALGPGPGEPVPFPKAQPDAIRVLSSPRVAGQPLQLVSLEENGLGYDGHWTGLVDAIRVHVWATYHATNRYWAKGEILYVAHTGKVVATAMCDMPLSFERSVVQLTGVIDNTGLHEQCTLAAGQARAFAFRVVWDDLRLTQDATNVESYLADWPTTLMIDGCQKIWPDGDPLPLPLERQTIIDQAIYLSGWAASPLGVAANANTTGREGDQVFVGGESLGPGHSGAAALNYLIALGYARRPIHHVETNGELLRLDEHPNLWLWDGFPHLRGGATDRLGLDREPTVAESHGWRDWTEHEFFSRLAVGYRLTGSPCLQWLLGAQARQWMLTYTIDPRASNTRDFKSFGTAREWGWHAQAAYMLWHYLEDRGLAEQIRERFIARKRLWDVQWKTHGSRLEIRPYDEGNTGRSAHWAPFRNSMACYWTWKLGVLWRLDSYRQMALDASLRILSDAFSYDELDRRWRGWGYVGVERDGTSARLVEGDGAHWGRGVEAWMVLPIAVMAFRNDKARVIAKQYVAEHHEDGKWLPPDMLAELRSGDTRA